MAVPSRRRAIRQLADGRSEIVGLIEALPSLTRRGIGGGTWSARDLLGHLAMWERFALEALDDWEAGVPWSRDREIRTSGGVDRANVSELARTRRLSTPEVIRRADRSHAALIDRLNAMSDAGWRAPAGPRGRRSVGERLGGILGGPAGPFRHADAHLDDLREFVRAHADR